MPLPMPATRKGAASAQPTADPCTTPISAHAASRPRITSTSPAATSRRPYRNTTWPASTADSAPPIAHGIEANPAISAL